MMMMIMPCLSVCPSTCFNSRSIDNCWRCAP